MRCSFARGDDAELARRPLKINHQLGDNLQCPVLAWIAAVSGRVRGERLVPPPDEVGDVVLVEPDDRGQPAIDEIVRRRELHVETGKERDGCRRIGEIVADHPVVDGEDPNQSAERIDAERDEVMDRTVAALGPQKAMEVTVLGWLCRAGVSGSTTAPR